MCSTKTLYTFSFPDLPHIHRHASHTYPPWLDHPNSFPRNVLRKSRPSDRLNHKYNTASHIPALNLLIVWIRAQKPICHGLRRWDHDAQVCWELKIFGQLLLKTATEPWANVTCDKQLHNGWHLLYTPISSSRFFFVYVMLVITFLMIRRVTSAHRLRQRVIKFHSQVFGLNHGDRGPELDISNFWTFTERNDRHTPAGYRCLLINWLSGQE